MRKDLEDDEYEPDMPPLDAEYLSAYLFEIGPTMSAGGYPGPITNGELDAWCNRIGIDLQPWESRFLCRLSREYVAESHRAEKADCPAPWASEELVEERREALANKVRTAMRSFVNVGRPPQ